MMSAAAALASDPPHRREHLSVLADVEKRVLFWLAKRLPAWVTSDGLTALGAVAMAATGLAFAGVGPTELRILLSIGAVVAFTRPMVTPFGIAQVKLFDLGGLIGAAGMGVVFVLSAIRNARALSKAEPHR